MPIDDSVNLNVPASVSANLGVNTAINGVQVVDDGLGGETFTFSLSHSVGTILLKVNGVNIDIGGPSFTDGTPLTLAQINAAFATLSYDSATAGSDSIAITVTDSDGSTITKSISVTTVGTGPADDTVNLTVPASVTATQGAATAINGVQVVDDGLGGETFTVMVSDGSGNLSATASGATITGSGTHSLAINGTLSQVNSALATLSYNSSTSGADSIAIKVTDSDGSTITKNVSATVASQPSGPFNYSVQLNDPTNAGGSADAILVYDIQQALSVWSQYISGLGTLVVSLNIASTTEGREAGGPTSSFFVSTKGGINIDEPSSLYELTTGKHVSGTTSDITITIDPGYFKYLDLAPNLNYNSQVASNEYNPIVVFLHEIEHGFGMSGWYSQSGSLPGNYESPFDSFIKISSSGAAYFTGPTVEAIYGGPVQLTTSSTYGENYYHFGNTVSDINTTPSTVQDPLTLDLMNGIVFFYNYQYKISPLDLAVLKDLGYNVNIAPVTSPDMYITKAGTTLTVASASGVLANDIELNGLSVSTNLSQTTAHGTLVLNQDGSFTYTPQAGFIGTDSFTYTASDAHSSSAVTTASIVVGSLNALTSPQQMLTELYVGYYDRAPDVGGLNYWLANYTTPPAQSSGGVNPFYQNLGQAAASFADPHQTETVALYPFLANPSTANYSQVVNFVDSAYANLFNRAPDSVGEEYWATSIAKGLGIAVPVFGNPTIDSDGPVAAAQALLALINGAQGNDAQTIANKVTAGLYYYDLLAANNVSSTQASAQAAFSGVTSDPATVLASEAATYAFVHPALYGSAAMIAPVGILDSVQSLQNGA